MDRHEADALSDAVELYLTDVLSRVRPSTVPLHRVLLRDSLLAWCNDNGYRYLFELDVKALIEYRSSWNYAPLTASKKFADTLVLPLLPLCEADPDPGELHAGHESSASRHSTDAAVHE
jgi:hypothetical protein